MMIQRSEEKRDKNVQKRLFRQVCRKSESAETQREEKKFTFKSMNGHRQMEWVNQKIITASSSGLLFVAAF